MSYLSPCCQQIVRQNLGTTDNRQGRIIVRSCLSEPDLQSIVLDHKCNGCILTPSGLYSDMAVTIAKHIYSACNSDNPFPNELAINIKDLQVHKPLIVKDPAKISDLWIEVEATFDSGAVTSDPLSPESTILLKFHSITPEGIRLQEQGHCTATFESQNQWLTTWSHLTPTLLDRISHLRTRAIKETTGSVRLVQRDQAYKLFETFVQYGPKYQNMAEVVYDTTTLEATSTIDFGAIDKEGKGNGPYYMDGSCHLAGFVCNAVDESIDRFAYINAGVGSMRLSGKFKPERIASGAELGPRRSVMRNYVRMRADAADKTVLQGDVFILQDGEIVGVWEAVKFKRIPRRVLNVFLPPPKK